MPGPARNSRPGKKQHPVRHVPGHKPHSTSTLVMFKRLADTSVTMRVTCVLSVCLVLSVAWVATAQHRGTRARGSEEPYPRILGYKVVAEYPHDMHSFTQGIQYDKECDETGKQCKDIFWESAGLYGISTIRKVDLQTGQVTQKETLPEKWFAEGLTRLGDHLYQLVWQKGTIFKWAIKQGKMQLVGEFQGPLKDGWGLTTDGKSLIATDSGAVVYFIDPDTLKVTRSVTVKDGGKEVKWLNELEVINGELWANIWQSECIARIDMASGQVTHWMLLHGLKHGLHQRHPQHHDMDVLNGIAYDAEGKRLFVTGKKWPRIFEITPVKHAAATRSIEQVRTECHAHRRLSMYM